MTIRVGENLPKALLKQVTETTEKEIDTSLLGAHKALIFGLPGAYTPVCSSQQVPAYLKKSSLLKEKGIEDIFCLSVNDPCVMRFWARDQKVGETIKMLCDGNGEFTKKLGLEIDLSSALMGVRCKRFVMIVENHRVTHLDVEDDIGMCHLSHPDSILAFL